MKQMIPMLVLCILTTFNVASAGDTEQAEQRFREALINYKQNATFRVDTESVGHDLTLLRQAATAGNEYKRTLQSSDNCMTQVIQPTEELSDAAYNLYQAMLEANMAGAATVNQAMGAASQAAAKYQRAMSAWQTAITVCPQAVNPYLLQSGNP